MTAEVVQKLIARIYEGKEEIARARARGWAVPAWEAELNMLRLALSQEESGLLAWAWETAELSSDRELARRCRELLVELALDSYRDAEVWGSPAIGALVHLRDGE